MEKPSFHAITDYARVRNPKQIGPQEIPIGQREFKCECCNDSGVVQSWKLNRWALDVTDEPLDSIMSAPVLCTQFSSCGELEIQVFAPKDADENSPRTTVRKLSDGETVGHKLANGSLKALNLAQSRYIHNKVLEFREMLSYTSQGRDYIAEVRAAARTAIPAQPQTGRLMHIGSILAGFEMPPEPQTDDRNTAAVEIINPRDFPPSPSEADWEPEF